MFCNNCGKEIDDRSKKCDYCGSPVSKPKKKKPIFKRWWFWVIVVFLVLSAVGGGASSGDNNETQGTLSSAVEDTTPDVPTENATPTETEAPTEAETTEAPTEPPITTYHGGMYKVGSDLDAGEYFVTGGLFGAYIEVSSDSSGKLDSIITNDNIATFSFITVEDGQYFTVQGGDFVKAEDAQVPGADANGVYGAGMYRVGVDIPAGEYKVTCTSELFAYIEVASDSSGSLFSIITNDNIETSSYITVEEGQYFTDEILFYAAVNSPLHKRVFHR